MYRRDHWYDRFRLIKQGAAQILLKLEAVRTNKHFLSSYPEGIHWLKKVRHERFLAGKVGS